MTGPSVKFSVIVLAGQRPGTDPVAEARGVKAKALAPVAGRAMILNVLDALEASPWVGDVYITLEDPKLSEAEPRLMAYAETGHIVQGTGTICGSVLSAVETRDIKTPFLVVTADHALLTADMLDHFCEDAAGLRGGETGFPVWRGLRKIVPPRLPLRHQNLSRFPG